MTLLLILALVALAFMTVLWRAAMRARDLAVAQPEEESRARCMVEAEWDRCIEEHHARRPRPTGARS